MSALPLLGWLVAGGLGLVVAWLWVDLVEERRVAERQRIERETVSDWADEYQREATALAAELATLRQRHATLTELYGEAVRLLLAVNYVVIHRNVEWKRRRQDR